MRKYLLNLITEWRRLDLPVKDETFVAAVSGGADSVSLLLALHELKEKKKLGLEFVVAHFNHELRGAQSDRDETFVRKLSEKLGFIFESAKWNAKKNHNKSKDNLEQAARLARYRFLEKTAEKFNACGVLTAHTLDDQAETFLLRLIRGSGLDGLGAMKPVRALNEGKKILLARPLLHWAQRGETEGFCRARKVKYRNDPMNRDEAFLRVRVRKQVLPLLQNINPRIAANLAKMSGVLRQEIEELDSMASKLLAGSVDINKETIEVKSLAGLSPAMLRRILRLWLRERRGDLRRLDMKHFTALERLVLSGQGNKKVELPGGESVTLSKGRLVFKKRKVEKSVPDN